eukprot:6172256-Pleurochrysis_carterae.AAC.3
MSNLQQPQLVWTNREYAVPTQIFQRSQRASIVSHAHRPSRRSRTARAGPRAATRRKFAESFRKNPLWALVGQDEISRLPSAPKTAMLVPKSSILFAVSFPFFAFCQSVLQALYR